MDPDTLRVLQAADDAHRCESPPSFDWNVEIAKVRELAPVLEGLTGRKFEIDDQVQDASFFADLRTCEDVPRRHGGRIRYAVLAVRFSAFGRLFSVCFTNSAEEKDVSTLSPEVVSNVIEAVRQRGYVYIDADSLDVEYTGTNAALKGVSWWIRYFDYL